MVEYILSFFANSLYVPNYSFDFFKMLKMLVESLSSLIIIISGYILIFFANSLCVPNYTCNFFKMLEMLVESF